MNFQYTLNFKPLLVDRQKYPLYKIKKKSVDLLLVILFINNMSATEADDINNTPSSQYMSATSYRCLVEPGTEANCADYINLATAPTQRAFDYDPGMLPEVAEVIFALRIKHANAGKPYIINLSGNYLLKFTKDRIHILDMYTKNSDVYEYQSTDPNITLGLSISKGLPRNYKGIIIKEDAHGKLYDYAALRSDNISTDETMLSETLSHPFYEVAGQDGGEDQATISKAMAFYHEVPSHSHSRHARCVKESMGILEQIQQILGSGSLVCGPKAVSDIRSANHQSAAKMKLDQPLVEAPVKTSKYPERLGYHLEERVDLNGENPVAVLAAADQCQVSVKTILRKKRQKRSPDSESCPQWAERIVEFYMSLELDFNDINQIVASVKLTKNLPASYFPGGQYPLEKGGIIAALVTLILDHPEEAAEVLQRGAAKSGQAAGASSFVQCPDRSQACGESSASEREIEIYTLNGQQFIPEPNVVRVVNKFSKRFLKTIVLDGEKYRTNVLYSGDNAQRTNIHIQNIISFHRETLEDWINSIKHKIPLTSQLQRNLLRESINIINEIIDSLDEWQSSQNLVVSFVYHNNVLIGITTGRINGRTYYPEYFVSAPSSLFADNGAFKEQLTFLRSEVIRNLLSRGLIDSSELAIISQSSTGRTIRDDL